MKNLIIIILLSFLHFVKINSQELQSSEYAKLEAIYFSEKNDLEKTIGLKISLDEGWKTYWKYPGDSGEGIQVEILNKENIKEFKLLYPMPKRFIDSGIETIGYENQVIFPLKIKLKSKNLIRPVNLKVNYLICKEICLPITENIKIFFENKKVTSTSNLTEFRNTLKKIPNNTGQNFKLERIEKISNKHLRLYINKKNQSKYDRIFIFSELNKFEESFSENKEKLVIDLISSEGIDNPFDISIYISDKSSVEEINLKDGEVKEKKNILLMILFALVGGFILNFMPCVFPILSLKIYSLIKIKETSISKVSKLSFITFLGISFSFLLIALMAIILKEVGLKVGWGMQFQSKEFISFLSLLIFIFSLNLFGFFEIILPNKVVNFLNVSSGSQNLNAFITGAVSTILATPCSAPFIGTAIGYALSQNSLSILLIFSFLSIGFSLPYLLISIYPRIINFFPKPGKWMNLFKLILGFMMLITSVWLLSLLEINLKILYFILVSVSLLLIILNNKVTLLNKFFVSLGIIIFVILLNNLVITRNSDYKAWHEFNEEKLSSFIKNDEIVFLDVTADWCVTCQINKFVVMNNPEVNQFFLKNNVVLMRADWTDKNLNILNFLSKYSRSGVPFNIVFGPENNNGIIFSELLTKKAIFKEISLLRRSYEN